MRAAGPSGESERWMRAATQNSSDFVVVLDADGTVRYASPAVKRVLGYRPEDVVGSHALDLVHSEDLERASRSLAEAAGGPGSWPPVEYRVRAADGSWRHVEAIQSNWLDDPSVAGLVANVRDVTERKEAEERFRSLVQNSSDVTAILGADGTTLYASPSIERVLGHKPGEVTGANGLDLIHPDDLEESLRLLAQVLSRQGAEVTTELRLRHADGSWRDVQVIGKNLIHLPSIGGIVVNYRDITERKEAEDHLHHRAFHDDLTDLPNRQLFVDRLERALGRTRGRSELQEVAVLFMDLDDFKVVNDSLGHEVGDRLLVALAGRLRGCLRPGDTLARLGGDEFTVLVKNVQSRDDAVRVAERIMEAHREPFVFEGQEIFIKPSIGIALGSVRTASPKELLRDADTAMYRAKEEGAGYRVFEPVMYEQVLRRLRLENDLRRAVEAEEFVVHYQPIFDLRSEEVWGMEALVRWQHPERGLLDPDAFVPAAEESGLVIPMGERVLKRACEQAREWQESYPHLPPWVISVNLSARQLAHPHLSRSVKKVLRETGLEASTLSLDVTETLYVKTLEGNTAALDDLKRLGVRISIDDFGTGYSSLSYLKRIPADALKVDKSFVGALGEDIEDTVIVQMIVDLAHTFGMEVIAEGIESEGHAEQLKGMGCDLVQGYFFSKPLPPEAMTEFLAR